MVARSSDKAVAVQNMENDRDPGNVYCVGRVRCGLYRLLLAIFALRGPARGGVGFYMGRDPVLPLQKRQTAAESRKERAFVEE